MTAATASAGLAARRTGRAVLVEPQRHQRDDNFGRLGVRQEKDAEEDGEVKEDGGRNVPIIGPLAEAVLRRRTRPWLHGGRWRALRPTVWPKSRQPELLHHYASLPSLTPSIVNTGIPDLIPGLLPPRSARPLCEFERDAERIGWPDLNSWAVPPKGNIIFAQ
jgi:hypothetical protein